MIIWPVGGAVAAFDVATLVSRWVDRRMRDTFSAFWHPHQPELRKSLKRAHAVARAEARAEAEQAAVRS